MEKLSLDKGTKKLCARKEFSNFARFVALANTSQAIREVQIILCIAT